MRYGLIGEHLGHSFSKLLHGRMSSEPYVLCELSPGELPDFFRKRDFLGINVTIPYKQAVIPFLDELDPSAQLTGAVNTIVNRGGILTGFNTDYDGFIALSRHAGVRFDGARVVILGRGGAAKAAAAAALSEGAVSVVKAVRTPSAEGEVPLDAPSAWGGCDIIVNATPVGMYPHWDGSVVPPSVFDNVSGALDCIYNPLKTAFVLDAEKAGIPAEGGLYMLVAQAVRAREIFDAVSLPEDMTESLYDSLLRSKRNIVLCGMPSCGKTTIGKALAERCGRRFADTDELVVMQAGMDIPDIFSREGEAGFRARETAAIESIAAEQGLVIATGGGAVLSERNLRLLRHNGLVCLLERSPELLTPTADRPLSRDRASISALYLKRMPLYSAAADVVISNNGSPEDTLEKLASYVDRG